MEKEQILTIIKAYISKMPSLPTTVSKILQICNDPKTSPSDLNQVISLDPVLMGKVMRLINSAYYSLPNQVTSLVRAIIMLGINTVKNLAISTAILGNLGKKNNFQALNMNGFWRHSIGVGVTSKMIARYRKVDSTLLEGYFVAGLLHDLGKIPGIRVDHGYAKLDHPGTSAGIVKECLGQNAALAAECSEIVLYHHGEPPRGGPYIQGLEILKDADGGARKRELQKALGHLKSWKDIPPETVAEELTSFMLDAIRSGDMARDLFYLNQKQGLLYVNPDVLIEILQTISRDTYLWPEIFAPDSRMTEKALRDFLADRLKPEGWLTENFSQEKFLWLKIDKMGKLTGPRPFIEIVFMKLVQAAGITPSKIIEPWRKSFLKRCRVLPNQ